MMEPGKGGAPANIVARVKTWLPTFERTNHPLLALKLVAMTVFLAATNHDIGKRSLAGYAFFFFAWLVSVIALLHVAFFASRLARVVWTLLVVASAIVGSGFRVIFDAPLTLPELDRLMSLLAFIETVFQFYGRTLAGPIALCLVVGAVAINVPPFAATAHKKRSHQRRFKELALQLSPVALMVGVLFAKHGEGTNGLPVQHTSLSFLAVFGIERIFQGPAPRREEVTLPHSGQRPLRNIIVVMDESIRGDLLDLNDEHGTPTGLKGRAEVINFGVMSSLANCSHESNVAFRYGIGRRDYLRQLAVNPSMWAYAKTAGYDRFYLDAQRTDGALQNGMTPSEVQEMTRLIQLGKEVQAEDRDTELARALRRVLSEQAGKPTFVYANKAGAHYPYEGKYPSDRGWYSPVLARDYFGNEADPKMKGATTLSKSTQDSDLRIRVKNSYMNAVGWNASRFFEVLLDGLDLSGDARRVHGRPRPRSPRRWTPWHRHPLHDGGAPERGARAPRDHHGPRRDRGAPPDRSGHELQPDERLQRVPVDAAMDGVSRRSDCSDQRVRSAARRSAGARQPALPLHDVRATRREADLEQDGPESQVDRPRPARACVTPSTPDQPRW